MGRKRTPGIYKRRDSWHIDKQVFGHRICESTGSDSLEEAEKYLARRIENLRQVVIYGARPKRKFREAAAKFLRENQHKKSIQSDAEQLEILDKYIGDLPIEAVHIGTLQPFIVDKVRGQHPEQVFTYNGRPTLKMLNSAWKRARKKAGLAVRVHDLKHIFGRRLRAAGVSFEDRQDLLGHRSERITTHYSAAEIGNLVNAANKVCETEQNLNGSTLTLLRAVQINAGQSYANANLH
jgi:hypothetical protein